ncbi:MAG: hypothetical protein ACRD0J_13575, partial [Acidimicrobiales bacterium]
RAGSVFHGAAYLAFDPAALPDLLAMGAADRQAATAALAAAAGPLAGASRRPPVTVSTVEQAVVDHLP